MIHISLFRTKFLRLVIISGIMTAITITIVVVVSIVGNLNIISMVVNVGNLNDIIIVAGGLFCYRCRQNAAILTQ